ncbi:MAG: hemerythrin domain-containing protein [Chloroflexi bacterium]|nr:hemerythrin domain-containing protein [Chloroflexota bacterium]
MSDWETLTVLRQSHDAGLDKLKLLEDVAEELRQGRSVETLPRLRQLLRFFNGELRTHFLHEENGLFPVLARIIGRMGPIGAMIEEHQSLWRAVETLEEHVIALERGSAVGLAETEKVATHIVWFLRSHIQKENDMLFPLAERHLSQEGRWEVEHRIKAA